MGKRSKSSNAIEVLQVNKKVKNKKNKFEDCSDTEELQDANEGTKVNKKLKNKKNKFEDCSDTEELQGANEGTKVNKKVKNKKNKLENCSDTEESQSNPVQIDAPDNKNKRNKLKSHKNKDNSEEKYVKLEENAETTDTKIETAESCTTSVNKNVKTKKKNKACPVKNDPADSNESETTNDKPDAVNNQTINRKKAKDTGLSQEDDVKDEDIDEFCDEITEEDNVQYENWVKLLEEKLSSNKKKSK